jgi:hypothetical protein
MKPGRGASTIGEIAAGALVLFLYLWTATQGTFSFRATPNAFDYYNLLAGSLLHGRLALPIEVPPELLALANPHDPRATESLRFSGKRIIHDLSLFEGKWYLYFGLFPALFLYLPWQVLSGTGLPDALAGFLLASLGFLAAWGLIRQLTRVQFSASPWWSAPLALLAAGLGNLTLYNLRRTLEYQIAILWAHALFAAALYCMWRAAGTTKRPVRWCGLASTLLGLAVGGRPLYVLLAILLPLLWFFRRIRRPRLPVAEAAALALPFGVLVMLLGVYNVLRFGSWTEFGITYQVGSVDWTRETMFAMRRWWTNLYLYFLYPPEVRQPFPFIFARTHLPAFITGLNRWRFERVSGLFPTFPFTALPLVTVPLSLVKRQSGLRSPGFIPLSLGLSAPLLAGPFLAYLYVTARFLASFDALFTVLATYCWLSAVVSLPSGSVWRWGLQAAVVGCVMWGVLSGLALGIEGCDGAGLLRYNPALYEWLSRAVTLP